MKNLAIPLLAATTQAQRRPASMALDTQDQGPTPVDYLGGLTGLVAHETVADSDPVEYVCAHADQADQEEMTRLKNLVVDAETAVQTQKDAMNEKAVTGTDGAVTGADGVVELLRLAQEERQAKIDAADEAREAIYVTVGAANDKAGTGNVTPFARAEEAEELLREAQEAYRLAQVADAAQEALVGSLQATVADLQGQKEDLAATTLAYRTQMNSAHLSIAIERQRHIIELCRVQESGWATTAGTERDAILAFRTDILAQWWSLQTVDDQNADAAAWGVLDADAKEAWYDRTTRADLETTESGSETWQNWAATSTAVRTAYFSDDTEKYAWAVQNGVNKAANANTVYARAVDISAVYWPEIAQVDAAVGQTLIAAIPARCIIPPTKFLVNDDSDHTLADSGDAFDATDDAIGDTFEVSTTIRIDPTPEDEDAANSLTRKMDIATTNLAGVANDAAAIAVAELIQRWSGVNIGMIELLLQDNKYRSELTAGAITASTSGACASGTTPDHSALCTGDKLAAPEQDAAAFAAQWKLFVGERLMLEEIYYYGQAAQLAGSTTVTIGATAILAANGIDRLVWDRDAGSTQVIPYLLEFDSGTSVTTVASPSSAGPAWPDAYYAEDWSTAAPATRMGSLSTDQCNVLLSETAGVDCRDTNAWAWYQSAAALSEATRKMYKELTTSPGNYYHLPDTACDSITADVITAGDGWVGNGSSDSAACATLCDAKQAYHRASGDRDSLPDVTKADDNAAATGGSGAYCFGYKYTADSGSTDAQCALGVRHGEFDVAADSAGSGTCRARFASIAVYGTAAGVGTTTATNSQAARVLNGGDGSGAGVGFVDGYVAAYKEHYGARDAAGGTLAWDDGNTYATPGAFSREKVMTDMISSTAAWSDGVSSGVLATAKAFAEERVRILEMGFFAFYQVNDKAWVDALGLETTGFSDDNGSGERYRLAHAAQTSASTGQDAIINTQSTLDGLNAAVSTATGNLATGVAARDAAASEVQWQVKAYGYAKADYDAAKALSDAAENGSGPWATQDQLRQDAETRRGDETTPAADSTRGELAAALIAFDAAFNYEATAAPPTLFDDLNAARGERDTAVRAFNTAVSNLATEQSTLDGLLDNLAEAKANVVADDLKCKSENFDAYTAGLLSRRQTREELLDDIQAFIESDTPPAAGTLGARCEKALSNGTFRPARASGAADPEASLTCIGETACCGASRVPLDGIGGFLTVETCGTTEQEKYTYRYPREPLAKTRDSSIDVTFTCIEGAQRLAAAAAAAATALYMLA